MKQKYINEVKSELKKYDINIDNLDGVLDVVINDVNKKMGVSTSLSKDEILEYMIYDEEECELSEEENVSDETFYSDDLLKIYLKEIGNIPLLTRNEEYELSKKIKLLRKNLEKDNISIKKINSLLIELGYSKDKINDNSLLNLKNKKMYLEKERENIHQKEKINKIENTIKMLEQYYDYKLLVDKFMNANLRLVVSIAKNQKRNGVSLLDMIQFGNEGLMKAIEKYDVDKGFRFSTYATWWIRQSIKRGVYDINSAMHFPSYMYEKKSQFLKKQDELVKKCHRNVSYEEVFEELEFSEFVKQAIIYMLDSSVSLNKPVNDETESTLLDLLEDSNVDLEKIIEHNEMRAIIDEVLSYLSDLDQKIIKLRFGIDEPRPRTIKEISNTLGLSSNLIMKHQRLALRRLTRTDVKRKLLYYEKNR